MDKNIMHDVYCQMWEKPLAFLPFLQEKQKTALRGGERKKRKNFLLWCCIFPAKLVK